jgi:hypothetical protein
MNESISTDPHTHTAWGWAERDWLTECTATPGGCWVSGRVGGHDDSRVRGGGGVGRGVDASSELLRRSWCSDAPGCQILPVPEFIPPMSPLFNGWTIPLRKFGAGPLSRPQTSRPGRNFTGPFLGQAALNSAIWKHQLWKVILEVWGGGVVPGSYGINPWKSLKGQFQGFLTFWPQNGHLKVQKSLMAPWKVLILCTGTILNPWNGVSDFQVFIL